MSRLSTTWKKIRVTLMDHWLSRLPVSVKPNTMLIVKLDLLGDYVLVRNFFSALKMDPRYTQFRVTLCGNIVCRDLAESIDHDIFDSFIWLDRHAFEHRFFYRLKMLRAIREQGFEIVLHPTYSRDPLFEPIIHLTGAGIKIGFEGNSTNSSTRELARSATYYSELIPTPTEVMFEFLRNRLFFESLLQTSLQSIQLHIDVPSYAACTSTEAYHTLQNTTSLKIAVCGGASQSFRRWDPSLFARLITQLSQRYNAMFLLTGSPAERPIGKAIMKHCPDAKITDYTGLFRVPELVGVLSQVDVVICNDTGVVHLAAAVGVKVICISNANHHGRFTEYPADVNAYIRHVYPPEFAQHQHDPRFMQHLQAKSNLDIQSVTVDQVLAAFQTLFPC